MAWYPGEEHLWTFKQHQLVRIKRRVEDDRHFVESHRSERADASGTIATVVDYHNSHGESYDVRTVHGAVVCYMRDELEAV